MSVRTAPFPTAISMTVSTAISMAISMVAAMACATSVHAGFVYVPPEETAPIQAEAGGDTLLQPEPEAAGGAAVGLDAREAGAARPGADRWHVHSGEMLRDALDRWGGRAGVEILFLTDRRYRLLEGGSFAGSFEEAAQALFSALSHLPHRPVGERKGAGRTLAILHGARPNRVPAAGDGR